MCTPPLQPSASHPTFARPWSAVDDDAVLPSGAEQPDADPIAAGVVGRQRSDPPLSAPASCQPAVLTAARRLYAWNWRRCCAPTGRLIGNRTRRPRCKSARCRPSRPAAPRPWAGMHASAMHAGRFKSATIPAATAIARNARRWPWSAGSPHARRN